MSFRLRTARSSARRAAFTGRRGFTLIELLVVITIIGMLMALLLPQLQTARESTRSSNCRSQLRSLAIALAGTYQTRNGSYPGYMNMLTTESGTAFMYDHTNHVQAQSGIVTPASWAMMIFPDIDRENLFNTWRLSVQNQNNVMGNIRVYVEILVCPSDPAPTKNFATPLSYVANCGQQDALATAVTQSQPYRDPQGSGMFYDNFTNHPLSPAFTSTGRMVVMKDALCADPKDKTILLSENVDARNYLFDQMADGGTSSGQWAAAEPAVGAIYSLQSCNQTSTLIAPTMEPMTIDSNYVGSLRINAYAGSSATQQPQDQSDPQKSYAFARPSSKHPQTVNVAYVGTNVQSLKDSVSYFVFAKLMCANDKFVTTPPGQAQISGTGTTGLGPFKNYQLSDGDIEGL